MNNNVFIIIGTLGGLTFFLQGMQMTGFGLQKIAGQTLKKALQQVTANKLLGILAGIVVTVLLQSSGATTALLVSFAGAGLISLAQTMGIILGSDIGTTITVQLIALKIADYALLIVAIGFLLKFSGKQLKQKYIGDCIMGIGLIFFGMNLMSTSVEPLKSYPTFTRGLIAFSSHPILGIIISALFTGIIQSSAATIGLALSLSVQGLIGIESAAPLIFGANIGSCVVALLSSLGASTEGKRVAVAHILFKVLGVIIFIPILPLFITVVKLTASDPARQIANAHSLFNIGLTILFAPFTAVLAKFVIKLVPDKRSEVELDAVVHLERQLLSTPVLALEAAEKETYRLGMMVENMVSKVVKLFEVVDEAEIKAYYHQEEAVDRLSRNIVDYLTDLSQYTLNTAESKKVMQLLLIINDLELMGDNVANLINIARKKLDESASFSEEGANEIAEFHSGVSMVVKKAVLAIKEKDEVFAHSCLGERQILYLMGRTLRNSHMRRLCSGVHETRNTTAIHLDLIQSLEQIANHAANIANTIVGNDDSTQELTLRSINETIQP
ncbi:MAG TPA: Na/Pi cotransporter family protein [Bacillota bacterium]|nr:Na/Pi cotransporter family protein [Bacillota bacterium]